MRLARKLSILVFMAFLRLLAQTGLGDVTVSSGAVRTDLSRQGPAIWGKVIRAMDGAAVARFELRWRCGQDSGKSEYTDGNFQLIHAWPTECDLTFSAPLLKTLKIHIKADKQIYHEIDMQGFRTIRGHILSGALPGRGVQLLLQGTENKYVSSIDKSGIQAFGDENGDFHYRGLIPGVYTITSANAMLPCKPVNVKVAENEDPPPVSLTVPESGRVAVTLSPLPNEIDNLAVRLYDQAHQGNRAGFPTMNIADRIVGQYISEAVSPGKYWLDISRPVSRKMPQEIKAGIVTNLTVDLTPIPFHGRAMLHGRPVPDTQFSLFHLPYHTYPSEDIHRMGWAFKEYVQESGPLRTDGEGRFLLADLAPGSYLLEGGEIRSPIDPTKSLHTRPLRAEFVAPEKEQKETLIRFPEGRISTVVMDHQGRRVGQIRQDLFLKGEQWWGFSGEDGSFVFDGLGDGEYRLSWFDRHYHGNEKITINRGIPDRAEITIRIPSEEIRGIIRNWKSPGEKGWVSLAAVLPEKHSYSGDVNDDGSYSLHGIPPGKYLIRAFTKSENFGPAELTLKEGAVLEQDFTLEQAGILAVNIILPAGVNTWEAFASLTQGPNPDLLRMARVMHMHDHPFEFYALPPGTYEVTAEYKDRKVTGSASVSVGETAQIEIRFDSPPK